MYPNSQIWRREEAAVEEKVAVEGAEEGLGDEVDQAAAVQAVRAAEEAADQAGAAEERRESLVVLKSAGAW
jgi:hypothetical protein